MLAFLAAASLLFGPSIPVGVAQCYPSWDSGLYVDCSTEPGEAEQPQASMFIVSIGKPR